VIVKLPPPAPSSASYTAPPILTSTPIELS